MPNYEKIAERIVSEKKWTHEGETTDGTPLSSCPICGCIVPVYLQHKHAYHHAIEEEV